MEENPLSSPGVYEDVICCPSSSHLCRGCLEFQLGRAWAPPSAAGLRVPEEKPACLHHVLVAPKPC